MTAVAEPRPDILEIGHVAYFKRLAPSRTCFVAVESALEEHALADHVLSRWSFPRVVALARSRRFALAALRINHHPGRGFRRLFASLARPRPPGASPLAVLDFEDEDWIHPAALPLLGTAHAFYKRELPLDRGRLLRAPTGGPRARAEQAARLGRLRPLALGLPLSADPALIPAAPADKTADVFFAGRVEGDARVQGLIELHALGRQGLKLDAPAERLPPAEFYRRAAAAWLTWSPSGLGWDCFRHYEAGACRSVPVIDAPSTERHAPLLDGVHAVLHDPRPGGLSEAVTRALADKPQLARMAEAARAHVLAHHTPQAIAGRILAEAGAAPLGSL